MNFFSNFFAKGNLSDFELTGCEAKYIMSFMNAEIIGIGTELLLGDIVNSNAAYLSQKFAESGIGVYRHSVVGDNPARIVSAIRLALSNSDIAVTTGGLGPTVDDVTVAAIANALGKKLIFDKTTARRIKGRFRRRHIKLPKNNLRQAYIPKGAIPLRNEEGTAPGLFIKLPQNKLLLALPGPPRELEPMFEKFAAPLLLKMTGPKFTIKSRTIKTTGLPESAVCEKVKDILELKPPTTVGIYARLGEVSLKITTRAKNETEAKKAIAPVEKKIRSRLENYIFGVDNQTLEGAAGGLLLKNKKTLGIAESCTGGLIASRITDVPGSSNYFKTAVIAYANEAKRALLGVGPKLLKKYGAVSKEAAVKMAQAAREIAGTDIGLGVTGIAGPAGATRAKPVGLVYIALAAPKKTICKKFHFLGGRIAIKQQASQAALNLLRMYAGRDSGIYSNRT